jgi:small GTP-binding protein
MTTPLNRDIPDETNAPAAATRCGVVSILGRPNAGKSTLMNAMLGERLSIVSPKAQTTWLPVTGIWTEGGSQLVFVDTPGLLSDPADLLQASLIEHVASSVRDSDLAVLVLDPLHPVREESWNALMTILRAARVPVIGVITKTDLARPEQVDRERERVEKELPGARDRDRFSGKDRSVSWGSGLPRPLGQGFAAVAEKAGGASTHGVQCA